MSNTGRGRRLTPEESAGMRGYVANGAGLPDSGTSRHLGKLADLKPEIASIDLLTFTAQVSATGVVTPPSTQNLPGGYYAQLEEVRGYMQEPGINQDLLPLVTWNVRDRERSGDVFTTDQEMAFLVDPLRGQTPLKWENGVYVFEPGSTIDVRFAVKSDASNVRYDYATQASEAKLFGLQLKFNLIAVR